ncbi:hypothetical protein [Streptomyces sp. NPDC003077]|uniref:hypothetical protein n=1 Tax=Streptomyces sp. NPDC003077 TaxID=3154443 RepID=UPI0033B45A50
MNVARLSATALLAAATVGLAAPAASASAEPNPIVPGHPVSISDDRRCAPSQGAAARSDLFGEVSLRPGAGRMAAEVPISSSASDGTYQVTIECGPGGTTYTDVVVVQGGAATRGVNDGSRTGLGGSVGEVSTSQAAGGVVLLAVAAGTAYIIRRHSRTG